jgi:hypothetical protein
VEHQSSFAYLVVCATGVAAVAPYKAVAAVAHLPLHIIHDLHEAERVLMRDRFLRGVIIDTHFEAWHATIMLLKRRRPDLFAVLFGDPKCSEPICVNAVVPNRDLSVLLALIQRDAALRTGM